MLFTQFTYLLNSSHSQMMWLIQIQISFWYKL